MSAHHFLPTLLSVAFGIGISPVSPALAGRASPAANEVDVLKAQAIAWDEAIVHKRRRAIEANMAPEFLHIGEDGVLSDRAKFLDSILSKHLSIAPYAMDGLQVRLFGDAALLTGTTLLHGTWRGKPFSSHYRFTDTYVRRGGAWRIVHVQITTLPPE